MTETKSNDLREALAALAHEQWSGWMRYLWSKTSTFNNVTEERLIPEWAVERWLRQMNTPYAELPEEEKESDRKEADRVLSLFAEHIADDDDRKTLLTLMTAIDAIERTGGAASKEPVFHSDLQQAISAWRDAEISAQIGRLMADEAEAKALQQVCHPEFVHPNGAKLTNEAARKAYATEQSTEEALNASVLEANARALRFWVESLIGPAGRTSLIHSIPNAL